VGAAGYSFGDSVMSSPITSLKLAERLTTALEGWVVSETEVQAARRIVKSLQSRYQRGRPGGKECVFEGLLRCRLTAYIMSALRVERKHLPGFVNSSHTVSRHVCIEKGHDHEISNKEWGDAFRLALGKYGRLIDIPVRGRKNPSRADLYLFPTDGVVSLELKYVGPRRLISVVESVTQMHRYSAHKRSFLIVYAAEPRAPGLEEKMHEVEDRLRLLDQRTTGLIVTGPEIARVDASAYTPRHA
jgi:hypothetical protein